MKSQVHQGFEAVLGNAGFISDGESFYLRIKNYIDSVRGVI
jgi:hypothetical protein